MRLKKGLITLFTSLCIAYPFHLLAQDNELSTEDLERFGKAMAQVRAYYVQDIKDEDILENAMEGMLNGLDPHSDYLDEEELKRLMENTTGEFAGLGIELTSEHGLIKVITPIDDTPASRAGIKPGDYISEVNGQSVHLMPLNDAVDIMRGKKNTKIDITVLRKGETKPKHFTLTRDVIKIISVKSRLLENDFGYIRITQFQKDTISRLQEALHNLEKKSGKPLQGLVLDLRNNPGGLLDSAVQVADTFLHHKNLKQYDKKIVYTQGRSSITRMEAKSKSGDLLKGAPMIVLINEGSASAAEIVAGALQDYRRAILLGKTSFGKGSVQTVFPLDDDHAIKLTTALYYTPSGRIIQAKGIEPDILIEDIKFKKSDTETLVFQPLTESKLTNHLPAEKIETDVVDQHLKNGKGNLALITEDFQLHEALNLLKAMHLTNQKIAGGMSNIQ